MNLELTSFSVQFLGESSFNSIEQNWTPFKTALVVNLIIRFIPVITIRCSKSAPWFSEQLQRASKMKKCLYRQAVVDNLLTTREMYRKVIEIAKECLKLPVTSFIVTY